MCPLDPASTTTLRAAIDAVVAQKGTIMFDRNAPFFQRLVRSRRFAVGAGVSASLLAATTAGAVAGIPGPNGLIQGGIG